jgi:RNA recognition motif-containing protein
MAAKLYIGSLAYATTDDSLRNYFASAGNVVSASVIMDKMTGRSRGFGFVEMDSEQAAQDAIAKLDGTELDGRTIRVSVAQAKERTGGNGGGGFRGGNRY